VSNLDAALRARLAADVDRDLHECGAAYHDALTKVVDLCDRTIWILSANDVRAAIAEALGVPDGQP
jgi:hypothetical protein